MTSSSYPVQPLRPTLGTEPESPLVCVACGFIFLTNLSEFRPSQKLNGIPTTTSRLQFAVFVFWRCYEQSCFAPLLSTWAISDENTGFRLSHIGFRCVEAGLC